MTPPRRLTRHTPFAVALTAAVCTLLALAPVAGADTTTSDNWSGYAAHKTGVTFKRATATWRQPAAICTRGSTTYSAFWVGIGGYSLSSTAMEQIGTELDCKANGTEAMSAWYELVPAPSRTISMTIASGDLMTGAISIAGRQVTLTLTDSTRHKAFTKTITDHSIDATSAEWIAEAPSECSSSASCTTLPLADFGGVDFSHAGAETIQGGTGAVASPLWQTTEILLGYQAKDATFVAETDAAQGTPTALAQDDAAFRVNYSGTSTTTTTTGAPGGFGGGGPGIGGPGGGRPFIVRTS